jgi:hypothetical protein
MPAWFRGPLTGQISGEQALGLARKWLWDNPKELYRLDV